MSEGESVKVNRKVCQLMERCVCHINWGCVTDVITL